MSYAGRDLQRLECILAEPDGTLWSADARGGVMQIRPGGSQALITQVGPKIWRSAKFLVDAHDFQAVGAENWR